MSEELMILTRQTIDENPEFIGEQIARLAKKMERVKIDIHDVKNRALLKMMPANGAKELTRTILKQGDMVEEFLTIIQGVTLLSMGNEKALESILRTMGEVERVNRLYDNKYLRLAKDYFDHALELARKERISGETLAQLCEAQNNVNQVITEQQNITEQIQENVQQYQVDIVKHGKVIEIFKRYIDNFESSSKEKEDLIEAIRRGLELQNSRIKDQDQIITELQQAYREQTSRVEEQQRQIRQLMQAQEETRTYVTTSLDEIRGSIPEEQPVVEPVPEPEPAPEPSIVVEAVSEPAPAAEVPAQVKKDIEELREKVAELEEKCQELKENGKRQTDVARAAMWIAGIVLLIIALQTVPEILETFFGF